MKTVEFNVTVKYTENFDKGNIEIISSEYPIPFPCLLMATETMMQLTAKESQLRFDDVMKLLVIGARNLQGFGINNEKVA